MNRIFFRSCSTLSETVSGGRFQHWRKPVYRAPHVHPLEVGPDFSFNDSRQIKYTSRKQVEYKLDQLRLGKQIVKYLGEIHHMEAIHAEALQKRKVSEMELERRKLVSKGTELLS